MAVQIGQALTAPESGWKRYDNIDTAIEYPSDIQIYNVASGYNGTGHAIVAGSTSRIKFSFKGTKIRYIGRTWNLDYGVAGIVIDGVEETFTQYSTKRTFMALNYEKTDLENKIHTVEIYSYDGQRIELDAIDIDSTGELLPPPVQVGDQLLEPEAGWKRYDDTHPAIKLGTGWTRTGNTAHYNSAYITNGGDNTEKVSFRFIGSKLRIGAPLSSGTYYGKVSVDGAILDFIRPASQMINQALVFEVGDLEYKEHDVQIWAEPNNWMTLDWFDIDAEGRLLHIDEVTDPSELTIGKRIRAHYTASSNQVGTFSNLGGETYKDGINDFISPASMKEGEGDGYFICVDEYNDKKICIFDRNAQHSISWDSINSEGFVNGRLIELPYEDKEFTIRLMSGGVDTNEKSSEWDNYIVNSSLNGSIVPGDNNVWNWSGKYSWTSSVPSGYPSNRTMRGSTVADTYAYNFPSNYISSPSGFRPVLEIESISPPPVHASFILEEGQYKKWDSLNNQWASVSATLPLVEVFLSDGMDLSSVPADAWNALEGDFDVVTYTNAESNPSVRMKATPYGQLVLAETDFSQVEDLTITASSEYIKLIASGDGGTTWQTFTDSWQPITASVEEVSTSGMTADTFNAITADQWKELGSNIRLGYYVEEEGLVESVTVTKEAVATETPTLDSVKFVYDEITIEGRMKELEQINAINMGKLQFKTNSLMNSKKFKLHDLVVDTFEEDSMVTVDGQLKLTHSNMSFTTPAQLGDGMYSTLSLSSIQNIGKVVVK